MTEGAMEKTDAELIEAYLGGDEQAFTALVSRHLDSAYRLINRYVGGQSDETEELVQEAFVRAWSHLERFDRARNFRTWLLAIARNAALDFLKKRRTKPFSSLGEDAQVDALLASRAEGPELPPDALEREMSRDRARDALAKLPPQYRVILTLHYHEQLTFREIADVLHEPLNTIKSRHLRGIRALRILLSP